MRTQRGLPRVGFVGVGWIGQHRMRAVLDSGVAEVVAICDPSEELRAAALQLSPSASVFASLEELLTLELDGIAIATPSALHAEQAIQCLEHAAVFCQKPLARTLPETRRVLDAARAHNHLLEVDFSYRNTEALRAVKAVLDSGELGPIYSARLVFHNAYGPDKPWYYDRQASGGGCVMDLGVHLVDSACWLLGIGPDEVERVDSTLYAAGQRLTSTDTQVEDYAVARLHLRDGALIELACSWRLPAGVEAEISAELFGPHGGVRFRNVNGSFYDFVAERLQGTSTTRLTSPPDDWGGRTIVRWAERLRLGQSADYDAHAEQLAAVASLIDDLYGRARPRAQTPRSRSDGLGALDTPR